MTDHLGTVRDLAQYDAGTATTTIANHRVFNAFGQQISETNAAVDHLFAYTGRAQDNSTGLQNNLNRWYDAKVGQWVGEDPTGFTAGDANLSRYVGNRPDSLTDPSGLSFLSDYWFYLRHPKRMDKHLRVGQKIALGTAAVLGGGAAGLAAGGAITVAELAAGATAAEAATAGSVVGVSVGGVVGYGIGRPLGRDVAAAGAFGGSIIGAFAPCLAPRAINITQRGLQHVLDRHLPSGVQSAGKSVFSTGEDVAVLIRQGQGVQAVQQAGGNFQRIVNAGRIIGIDRATGQATSIYTVITNAAGDLITAFPGTP